jgi:multidrug efflux pump subunit AcrA (membrane-fusion protein)
MAAKKTGKPKTTNPLDPEGSKEYKLEQKRAAAKLYSTSNQMYKTQPNVNYNLEWAKAKAVVKQAEQAKLARQAQNTANQNAYNQAQRVAQTSSARGDALSGRTPEGGTRSLLEGFRSFIGGGGLNKHGR